MEKTGKTSSTILKSNSTDYAKLSLFIFTGLVLFGSGSLLTLIILNMASEIAVLFFSNLVSLSIGSLITIAKKRSDDTDPQVLAGLDDPLDKEIVHKIAELEFKENLNKRSLIDGVKAKEKSKNHLINPELLKIKENYVRGKGVDTGNYAVAQPSEEIAIGYNAVNHDKDESIAIGRDLPKDVLYNDVDTEELYPELSEFEKDRSAWY